MKTAVNFMVEQLNQSIGLTKFVDGCDEAYKNEILTIIQQAKEMEKQQIQDAYLAGYCETAEDSQDYYDKTYNK